MYLPAQKIQSPSLLQFYLLPTCRPRTVQSVRASFPVVKRQYYRYLLYINYSIYSILLDLSSVGWTEKHTAGKTKDWTPRQRANQAPPPFFLNKYQDMHDYSHVHVDVGHMILWAYKRRDLLLIAFWEFFSPVLLLCLCNHQTFCALCVAARDKEFSKTFSTYHHCCHLYIDI